MREGVDQLERSRHGGYRLERVDVGKTGQARQFFIEARIVFHRARTERVEPAVDRVVLLREAGEVAHDLRLAEPRKTDNALPIEAAEAVAKCRRLGQIDPAMPR